MYLVRQLADRFPGIDIGDVISERLIFADSMDRAECIKGPSWLTLLSDPYVNELGGLDYLRMRLGDDFSVTTYEGGVMIQAGSKPEIGDVQQNRWPRHLITLSKVLRPLRFKEPFAIHGYTYKDHPTMDLKTTEAWMARFDDK
jgi:hypothetical protein